MPPRRPRQPETFLPLTPVVFEILVTLAARECHGYLILSDIRTRTGQTLRPGSLYRALNRLLDDGLVEELDERPDPELDDERRRYYRLSPLGRRVAEAEAARLDIQVRSARAAHLLERKRP
ncbi:MAG TPA: helix-turn-helix transcriptional regulator [Vicinamibacterales bacterium]|nr:helix-turn-helix transcriptional regulator [Vicinamibacterales bacterium]